MKIWQLPVPDNLKEIIASTGIEKLYPPQIDAINAGVLEGRNLVLASPTASGKTLIAELCALKHVMERNGKTLYLTPLRALANEKYNDFMKYTQLRRRDGRRIRVGISTGDYDSSDAWLGRYDIIVTTNEKADSLLRHRADWMSDISLVVADEIHVINDAERGPTLEIVLARLRQLNPKIQILALSATISNANEIAEWLNAEVVTTDWRPIPLREGVIVKNEIMFKDGGATRIGEAVSKSPINVVLHVLKNGGQVLIFTGTRKKSMNLAKKLAEYVKDFISKPVKRALLGLSNKILATGERTKISELLSKVIECGVAFHHAGLTSSHRRLIEESFRNGIIKVLTATPTLASGVNLPARTVIIHDYRRYEPGYGYYPISILEYKQMAGRAGRPRFDKEGEALLVAKTDEEAEYLLQNYIIANPERIWSRLGVERILRSHVLSTIAAGYAYNENDIYNFFDKTFYGYQFSSSLIKGTIEKIILFLYEEEMVSVKGNTISATNFGRRVSELYIDPVSAVIIRDALSLRPAKFTEISLLHMVSHTPDTYPRLRPYRREIDDIELFMEQHREEFITDFLEEYGDYLDYEDILGEVKAVWVLYSWIEERSEDEILNRFNVQPGDLFRLTESAKWLLYSSKELAKLLGHRDLIPKIRELYERVEKGVEKELLSLVKLKGIGRVRGRILYNAGFRTIEDIKNAPLEKLIEVPNIGAKLAMQIKEEAGGTIKRDRWERIKRSKDWRQSAVSEF